MAPIARRQRFEARPGEFLSDISAARRGEDRANALAGRKLTTLSARSVRDQSERRSFEEWRMDFVGAPEGQLASAMLIRASGRSCWGC